MQKAELPTAWTDDLKNQFLSWEQSWWSSIIEEYEYDDNFRVARKYHVYEVDAYNKLSNEGCCGSEDIEVIILADNKEYEILYGFNYGH